MAPPVYSLRIFSGLIDSTVGPVGPTVPADFIYVVRDMDVVAQTGATNDEFGIANPTGGLLWFGKIAATNPQFVWQWRGRQVYSPGERVLVLPLAGKWDVCISGYQLSLP